jgi:succinyl-CoA synthetase alpha subunit
MRTFQEILEAAGYECEPYSGRGMGGQECLSIQTDKSVSVVFADVLEALTEDMDGAHITIASKAFREMREDSLGCGIVVYFPGITVS